MSDIAVSIRGLGKQYQISSERQRYRTFRDSLASALTAPVRRTRKLLSGQATGAADLDEAFWALRDISLDVQHGEAVGIIGRNGAGKTTLLKVLSRITEPTEGRVELFGRVGSLLEVGTGFHPELTGRENVYLNGAILGMRRTEIERKFDEIVDFSEIGKFIDTPVKHYSSGMYIRLAFAVAAHLDPEIFIVDEVLAVGDVSFQKKCLGKMGDVTQSGRTVLFVSHNLAAISALCTRGICLEGGRIVSQGPIEQVVSDYLVSGAENQAIPLSERTDRTGDGRLRFLSIAMKNESNKPLDTLASGETVVFSINYEIRDGAELGGVDFGITCIDIMGQHMFQCRSSLVRGVYQNLPPVGTVNCVVPAFPLMGGQYSLRLWAQAGGDWLDRFDLAFQFQVVDGDFYGTGKLPGKKFQGVLIQHEWQPASPMAADWVEAASDISGFE